MSGSSGLGYVEEGKTGHPELLLWDRAAQQIARTSMAAAPRVVACRTAREQRESDRALKNLWHGDLWHRHLAGENTG